MVAMMILMAGPAEAADTAIVSGIAASETFSDNIDLDPSGEKEDAFLSDLTPSLRVRTEGSRVSGALDAATILRYQTAGDDKGFNLLPNVVGFGNAELIEELFFLDASGSATRQLLNTSDGDTESNQENVFTYNVSPYLARRFGSFAGAELRGNFGQFLVDGSANNGGGNSGGNSVSDQTTYGGRFVVESGDDFRRFLWSANTSASFADRSDDDDVKRREATLGAEYVAFRYLSVLGTGGYQFFDDGDSQNDVDDPIWAAGLRIRPSPRAELVGTYGMRDDRESFAGDLRYDFRPNLRLTASYEEVVATAQEQFFGEPSAIGLDEETSEIIDPDTRQRFTPRTSITDIDDQTALTKTAQAALVGSSGRNIFELGGAYERRDTRNSDEADNDTDVIQGTAAWKRQLTPSLNMEIAGSYANKDFKDDDRKDDQYEIGASLTYLVFENLAATTSYSYRRNDSTDNIEEYVENRVTIGLRYTF